MPCNTVLDYVPLMCLTVDRSFNGVYPGVKFIRKEDHFLTLAEKINAAVLYNWICALV
jgi:hypothetical protein